RLSLSTDGMRTFRKHYEDAGVPVDIVKFDGIDAMPDDVVDYCFTLAKNLGARYISCEIPVSRTQAAGWHSGEAQDDGRLSRSRQRHRPGGLWPAGKLGTGDVVLEVQRRECGSRPFRRGQRIFAS